MRIKELKKLIENIPDDAKVGGEVRDDRGMSFYTFSSLEVDFSNNRLIFHW